ncbi:hypothetical protein KCU61_g177, partial [Aureobasidium melanogenum]
MTLILRVRLARSSRRILFASSTSALDGGLFSSFSSLIGTTLREVSMVRDLEASLTCRSFLFWLLFGSRCIAKDGEPTLLLLRLLVDWHSLLCLSCIREYLERKKRIGEMDRLP